MNCSIKYNLTEPFNIPDQCNQIVSAGKCLAYVRFSYHTQDYDVHFYADSSSFISGVDNQRYVSLTFSSYYSPYFTYNIYQACKNKNDCARDLMINTVNEILERQYNLAAISNEIKPLITYSSLTSDNSILNCYDSNQNIRQCSTSTIRGSCYISYRIIQNTMNRSCDTELFSRETSVFIYSSNNFATFNIHCNQSLCNEHLTLQAVKDVMFKYNVTITLDGRLNHGSRFMISIFFIIMMMSLNIISNRY